MKKKIYLASSWRNTYQQQVLADLRAAGHEVYDFKNPGQDDIGFGWSQIDPNWKDWTPEQFKKALQNPIARKGHRNDQNAMDWCNACVLLLPSGRCAGKGKPTVVYCPELREPELMYKTFELVPAALAYDSFCIEFSEVLEFLDKSATIL